MTILFQVVRTDKKNIEGFLVKNKDAYELIFSNDVFGEKIHNISQKDEIKNPERLIASYLANSKYSLKNPKEKYLTVEILGEDGCIINVVYADKELEENKKRTTYFLYKDNWILSGQELKLETDIGQITVKIEDLGLEKIQVPNDFKYTKNQFINSMLKTIKAPYNVDKKLIDFISKNMSEIENKVYKKEIVYINKRNYRICATVPKNKDSYYQLYI